MGISIRNKILAITTGTVFVALALTSATVFLIVREDNMNSIRQNLDAIVKGNNRAVEEWISAKATAVKAASEAVEPGDPKGVTLNLQKSAGLQQTTVGQQDKFYLSSLSVPANYDPTIRPWYIGSMQAKAPLITKPYKSVDGSVLIAFTAPIIRNNVAVGVMSGGVSLDNVRNVISAIHPTPSSIGFVVDQDGTVISHPDAKYLLKNVSELSPQLTAASFQEIAESAKLVELNLDGDTKFLRAQKIAGTSWYLVVALDKKEATAGMQAVLKASSLAVIGFALLAMLTCGLMTARIFRRLSEINDAMTEIGSGEGDLTRRLPVIGNDEIAQIASSFNVFVKKIGAVLADIRGGSESMAIATREIEAGNLDLSQRTEIAASNLEEAMASLTQLTGTVANSAQSTIQATQFATSASGTAIKGLDAMSTVVATMDEIAKSSANVVEIVSVIDGIAFQTNILALNAAVEAARAGENGRGFAVVASEVRALAQRSATAAKEIKALIAASGESVKSGTVRVKEAGKNMADIVDSIERVTVIISEINTSMSDQSAGIRQIHRSVGEMEQSTQQNASLVEQATAASSVLKDHAQILNKLVSTFKLSDPDAATPKQASHQGTRLEIAYQS
jgi:methyl-accepting chemotaxis protein